MSNFDAYSRYYDLLYANKDYQAEANYVAEVSKRFGRGSRMLDLGCGSARHAAQLVQSGFTVHGVERSQRMFERALETRAALPAELRTRLELSHADARAFRHDGAFDVVTALFHVLSYQTDNDDVRRFLSTASAHLGRGGIFIADFWYGPAVLRTLPEARLKTAASQECEVIRFANPTLRINDNVVEVHYRVLVRSEHPRDWTEISERHDMRYFFLPELKAAVALAGLEIIHASEFLTGRPLSADTWGGCIVARKAE